MTRPSLAGTALWIVLSLCALAATTTAQRPKSGRWDTRRDYAEGWVVHTTKHYQVQSQCGKDKAKRLGKHMETMFRLYYKSFRPDRSHFERYPIKLFKDREAFLAYGAPPSAAAYYDPVRKEMVAYDTGRWMDQPEGPVTGKRVSARSMLERYAMDLLGTAAHEGWHQYFHWYVVSWVELPPWLNEGMGDYFYCGRPQKNPKTKKIEVELGRPNDSRLPIIWRAVKDGEHVPLKRLFRMSKADYYSNPAVCYSEGWAVCQFLLHHEKKKLRKLIPHFIFLVRDDTNMKSITKRVFRGIDLDKLDEEFQEWVKKDAIKLLQRGRAGSGAATKPARPNEKAEPNEEPGKKARPGAKRPKRG